MEVDKPKTVFVCGLIGAGKTSFLQFLKDSSDGFAQTLDVIDESLHRWQNLAGFNLFGNFYQNPNVYAFEFQSLVQLTMMEAHVCPLRPNKAIKVIERSAYSAQHCFVRALFELDALSHSQYLVLRNWFDFLVETNDLKPSVVVYLDARSDSLLDRIRERDRPGEESITIEYLEHLRKCYSDLLDSEPFISTPRILINTDVNFCEIQSQYNYALELLKTYLY